MFPLAAWFYQMPALLLLLPLLLGLFFSVLIFVTAMLERLAIRPLTPADPQRWDAFTPNSRQFIDEAKTAGFQLLGLYSDGDKGWKEGIIALLLSPDRQSLLWVQHRARRSKFISSLNDDHWLISTDVAGISDLSGLHDEQMLYNVPFSALLNFHNQRLTTSGNSILPFFPGTVIADVQTHEQHRVAKLVHLGLAKYQSPQQDLWSYTLPGAVRIAIHNLLTMLTLGSKTKPTTPQTAATSNRSTST